MKKHTLLQSLMLLFSALACTYASAQVSVNINSGNPAFPFPQFKSYNNGDEELFTLGTKNPEGVTHAEMEQTIREAYQIMANRFYYSGDEYKGVKYIIASEGCPYDCSEAYGYAMLAAAYMADKTTFDGIWFYMHDKNLTKSKTYSDCKDILPDYNYGNNIIADNGNNSATDGSEDMALALYVAYKQWGENSGITDACGNEISYKQEYINIIKGMSDTVAHALYPELGYTSGIIGFDGYIKNGDTWGEITDWASDNGFNPEFAGPQKMHIDYTAPSYYTEFAEFLKDENSNENNWNINQYRRAAASSDWLIGQHYASDPKAIPFAGWAVVNGSTPTFDNFNQGEDYRWAWRNAMDYMWHGSPKETWNPETHQLESGSNTFQKDMAVRYASFLKNPQSQPWENACTDAATYKNISFKGISTLGWDYTPLGENNDIQGIRLNWIIGAGASSAVVAQDHELMAQIYRQCELNWDKLNDTTANYFHGWFRLLGMLTVTGNLQAPSEMNAQPNLQTYLAVDKTVASPGEQVSYTIDFRNYGSADAESATLKFQLPEGLNFVSASSSGSNNASGTVTWDLGTLPGFKSNDLVPTTGQLTVVAEVTTDAGSKLSPVATISCANGNTASSIDIPNTISATYSKNETDVINNTLSLMKTASAETVSNGDNISYTLKYSANRSGDLTGGRPGVSFSFAVDDITEQPNQFLKFRVFHDAQEAYINKGNYRYSYFYSDTQLTSIEDWYTKPILTEGIKETMFSVAPVIGGNANANYRLMVQNPTDISSPDIFIDDMGKIKVHKGLFVNYNSIVSIANQYSSTRAWDEDWSWKGMLADVDEGLYYPVSPNWTDTEPLAVDYWSTNICESPTDVITNILVEEFDGYTWRKVAGHSPLEKTPTLNSVILTDTIPEGFEFVEFTGDMPMGITPTVKNNIISWEVADFLLNKEFELGYTLIANNSTNEDLTVSTSARLQNEYYEDAVSGSAVTVLASKPLEITLEALTNESYTGSADGAIDITISGGKAPYNILWSNNAETEDITGLSAGEYTVTVKDILGNKLTETIKVGLDDVITDLVITTEAVTNESYTGSADGAIDITISGGKAPYTIIWSNDAETEDITGLSAGEYTVTVKDALGTKLSETIKVELDDVIRVLAISTEKVTNESYTGSADGAIDITISGGKAPYTIIWSNDAETEDITGLSAGEYTVTAKDALGTVVIETIKVGLDEVITDLVITTEAVTNESYTGSADGAIDITISGGKAPYTIIWSNDAETEDITGLSAGEYTVTAKDALGNKLSETIKVGLDKVITDLVITTEAVTNESYTGSADGAIDITISGGKAPYTIIWSNDAETEDITGLSAGEYTVTAKDALGTVVTETIKVGLDEVITNLVISTETVTNESYTGSADGAIDITISGGKEPYAIVWSNGAETEDITGISAGEYTVAVVDALGGEVSETVTIGLDEVITDLVISTETVTNESYTGSADGAIDITISGGKAPYTIVWSNGAETEDLTALTTGEYTVTATDALGNKTEKTVSVGIDLITEPIVISFLTLNEAYPGADNGAVNISVRGGAKPYIYLWSNGADTEDISGLAQGEYVLTVTDAHNQTATVTVTVSVDQNPDPIEITETIAEESVTGAKDGSIALEITGGIAPYTIAWSNGANDAVISGLSAGDYSVTITDKSGEIAEETYTVELNSELLSLSGTLTAGEKTVSIATVILYTKVNGELIPAEKTAVNSEGGFIFDGLNAGSYYLYAVPSLSDYNNIVPTYYSNSIDGEEADAIELSTLSLDIVFEMQSIGVIAEGDGSISGNIGFSDDFTGDGFYNDLFGNGQDKSVVVYLIQNDEVVALTLVDANGDFSFNGLAHGDYTLAVENPGFEQMRASVTLSDEKNIITNLKFMVGATGINELAEKIELYPVPATESISVDIEDVKSLSVFNTQGTLVIKNENSRSITVGELPTGIYTLQIKTGSASYAKNFIKK